LSLHSFSASDSPRLGNGIKHKGEFEWLTPLVALVCVLLALGIFRAGLRRYESTGH
jgi:ABC-type uncharacterized transport system permease subunit